MMLAELSRLFPNSSPHTLKYICDSIIPTLSSNCADKQSQTPNSISNLSSPMNNSGKSSILSCISSPAAPLTPVSPLTPVAVILQEVKPAKLIQEPTILDSDAFLYHEDDENIVVADSPKQSKKIFCEKTVKDKIQLKESKPVNKLEKKGNIRDKWKPEEDTQLMTLYTTYGPQWSKIASLLVSKTGKQVRDRYINNLKPEIQHKEWTKEEEMLFVSLYKKYGNKWSKIAEHLPGRSGNQIKNKFHCDKKRTLNAAKNLTPNYGRAKSEAFEFSEQPLPDLFSNHSENCVVKETVDVFFEVQTLETAINICDIDFDNFGAPFNENF